MTFSLLLAAAIVAGTPLLFATLGEILTEKVGNLNLGVEGLMLLGAVVGFQVGFVTSNPYLALLGAMLAGAMGSLIFAFLTVTLRANQVVTGLSLTILGGGMASFWGQKLIGNIMNDGIKSFFQPVSIPLLSKIPLLGPALFHQDIFVYLGYILAIILGLYFTYTKLGLNAIMVGENPAAADAAGVPISLYKYIHILLGGALCGLGGAYLSLVYVPAWQENITAGRGWIAVALVIFSGWSPAKALMGAYLFGGLDILGFRLPSYGIHISQYFLDMLPYLVTILVLVSQSFRKNSKNAPPKGLGIPYFREER